MCCSCNCVDEPKKIYPNPQLPSINTVPEDLQIDNVDLLIAGNREFQERIFKIVESALGDASSFSIRIVSQSDQFENALLKREFRSPTALNGEVKDVNAAAFNVALVQYDQVDLNARATLRQYIQNQREHRTRELTNQVILISNQDDLPQGAGILHQKDGSRLMFSHEPYFCVKIAQNLTEEDWLGVLT